MKHKCECKHKSQDKINGKGIRVFNKTRKSKGSNGYWHRCTVCGKEV